VRIHPLGAATGEGAFRHDVGFEADKLKGRLLGRISAHGRDGFRAGLNAPGVLLIHVHAQVERFEPSEEEQRLGRNAGGGEFARAYVKF
jgi:hypothetical protein